MDTPQPSLAQMLASRAETLLKMCTAASDNATLREILQKLKLQDHIVDFEANSVNGAHPQGFESAQESGASSQLTRAAISALEKQLAELERRLNQGIPG